MLKKGLIDVKWGLRRIVCCLEKEGWGANPLPHLYGDIIGGGGRLFYIFFLLVQVTFVKAETFLIDSLVHAKMCVCGGAIVSGRGERVYYVNNFLKLIIHFTN